MFVLSERFEMQSEFGIGEVGVDGIEAAVGPERRELFVGEATSFCPFSLLGLTGFPPVLVSVPKPISVSAPTSPGFLLSLLLSLSADFISFGIVLGVLDGLSIALSTVVKLV